jgi:hypothetical protein
VGKPDGSRHDSGRKSGACVLIGGECCTFVPNNTAPDGTITKVLQGLTALLNELAKNSGINDPYLVGAMAWKMEGGDDLVLTSIVVFRVMTLVGCYVTPADGN